MAQKLVLKVEVHDEKERQKAMKAVTKLTGVESLSIDMKERKLTVVGGVDPVQVVRKLRKSWHTELLTVGPAKEPEKKKENEKKEDPKKDEKKKDEKELIEEYIKLYKNHYPYYTQYYHVYSAEENPNACVIS